MKITGLFIIQEAVYLGYPFLEAALSSLPIVDELFISDGGSTDETLYYLERLKKLFPKKIFLYHIPSFKSEYFEWVDSALNQLMKKAKGNWLMEIQGDEIWHEKDALKIREVIEKAKKYNSLRQRRVDCDWNSMSGYEYRIIRIFKNIKGVTSFLGGDDFRLEGAPPRNKKYTTHNVPPELESAIPFYHFPRLFPKNRMRLLERCVGYVATNDLIRREIWEKEKERDIGGWHPPGEMLDCYPALIKGLGGYTEYTVREELFDKKWLTKITGLKY